MASQTDSITEIIPSAEIQLIGFLKTFSNPKPFLHERFSTFNNIKINEYKNIPQYAKGIPRKTDFVVVATSSQSTKSFIAQKLGVE